MPRKSHVSRIVRAPSVAALLALATVVVLVSSFGGLAVPALALALLAIVVGVLAGRASPHLFGKTRLLADIIHGRDLELCRVDHRNGCACRTALVDVVAP